ncbi:MAG: DEAD/DEAH box helicase [Alphaproteobacteria bacterium]
MTNFASLGLPETLLQAVNKIGFNEPTPIQERAIPFALNGVDILGSAETGTGKTAAFMLPLIAHLIKSPQSIGVVLTPTRELAIQVHSTIKPLLLMHREINATCIIGGDAMPKQLAQLKKNPRIIVGTPGRINDHIKRGSLKLNSADFLVIDETDRMLDMGFGEQTERIIGHMASDRQTLMFSATLPKEIISLSKKYLVNPEKITINQSNKPSIKIKQELLHIQEGDKFSNLLTQIRKREGSILVFVKTKRNADRIAKKLIDDDLKACAIHGDLRQNKRDIIMKRFRDKKSRILVATDLASRGIDIPHIEHVINYDLPQCPEDYIHRIGRTARAGAEGEAVNLITTADGAKWKAIYKLMNPEEAKDQNKKENYKEKSFSKKTGKNFGNRKKKAKGKLNNDKVFSFKQHSRKGKNKRSNKLAA